MIRSFARLAAAGALAFCGLMTGPASATNGYIANGYGGGSKGMAGAGVAVPTGVLGMAQNPATGYSIGNMAGFCLTTFAPDRSVTVSPGGPLTAGTFKSRNSVFLIPCGGVNWKLNDRSTLGVFMFGNGGMNTEYDTNFYAGLGAGSAPLGVNLEQAFIGINYAWQANDRLTLGVAPIIAIQRFSATGLEAFAGMSIDGGNVTNRGDDWASGVGLNIGLLYEASDEWTIGAAYRSKINMGRFDKYAGLFAGGGEFDVPAVATLGAAFTPATNPQWTFTAEYQRIFYGDIPSIANPNAPPQGPLGADNGVGFGWDDMDVFRIGAIYRLDDRWTLRGGLSYATQVFDASGTVMNALTPATPQFHASIGASYKINANWGFTVSYTHAFDKSLTGSNPALTGVAQPVEVRMDQHEIAAGFTYRW